MGEVIVITSGKGGVGKTTTTANIGAGLSKLGKKVVIIDTDLGLRNLDVVMGMENLVVYNLVDVVEGSCRLKQALIRDSRYENLYLLPSAQTKDKSSVSPEQMKKLTESGQLKRFDTGIYYIPKKSMFRSGSSLSVDEVIRRKYLADGGNCCGYVGGILFANQLGLTTQVPGVYEVYTNKATTEYRETRLANLRVILRKPYCVIDEKNAATLQFLDLLKEIVDISEVDGEELTNRLIGYMKKKSIGFESMRQFLPYYPERIYKIMYEVGLLNGVAA